MKNLVFYYTAILTLALITSYVEAPSTSKPEPIKTEQTTRQIIKSLGLKPDLNFAGETLPLDNFDVRERMDRELLVNTYWHSSTLLNIKKSYKFFPIIERILEKNGIPSDFKYLAVAESNLTNATSPAGAKGFWQLMPLVAKAQGLEVSAEIDERLHLEKATQAACNHILDYKKKFGSWTMAAAAYNLGITKMMSEIKLQGTSNYFDLNLNEETSRYIFRLIAIKEIMSNPEEFGFYVEPDERYAMPDKFKTINISGPVHNLSELAAENGISYRMIKLFNPWILQGSIKNPGQSSYEIKIPVLN
jgi:membrane-bound lytic murein transglycosylase D